MEKRNTSVQSIWKGKGERQFARVCCFLSLFILRSHLFFVSQSLPFPSHFIKTSLISPTHSSLSIRIWRRPSSGTTLQCDVSPFVACLISATSSLFLSLVFVIVFFFPSTIVLLLCEWEPRHLATLLVLCVCVRSFSDCLVLHKHDDS